MNNSVIWGIIANIASLITIGALLGINESSENYEKVIFLFVLIFITFVTFIIGDRWRFRIRDYHAKDHGNGNVESLFVFKAAKLKKDKLVTIYFKKEHSSIPIAIGNIVDNQDKKYTQIDIVYLINDIKMINQIKMNTTEYKKYFICDHVRYIELEKLFDKGKCNE